MTTNYFRLARQLADKLTGIPGVALESRRPTQTIVNLPGGKASVLLQPHVRRLHLVFLPRPDWEVVKLVYDQLRPLRKTGAIITDNVPEPF